MQSNAEVKYMLKNCAWKEVTKILAEELQEQLKCLVIYNCHCHIPHWSIEKVPSLTQQAMQ